MNQLPGGVLRGEEFVGFDELMRRSGRAASALASLGIRAGDTIALLLRNDHAFFEASFAAAMIGAAPVPINWHATGQEVAYVLEDSRARLLVAHSDLVSAVQASLPGGLDTRIVPTPPDIAAAYGLAEPAGAEPEDLPWRIWTEAFSPLEHRPEDLSPFSMIYTSGTTGRPKGVRRLAPRADPSRSAPAAQRATGIEAGMRTVITGPMYHSAPNFFALAAARSGGFVVLQNRFDAEELLALVERHAITHLHMVPTMFVRLLRLPASTRARYDLSSLVHVLHAAAPCPRDVKHKMIDWLGPIVYEYYGATETGSVTFCDSEQWLSHPGTVGRPADNAVVKILDDDGRELPTGAVGEVFMRNHAIPDFTYEGHHDKRLEVERDGLITCGDVGYLDSDGFLYLCDRKRDMVISGGVNIYPAEIEACLITLAGVHDCAVFGIPDAEFGESLLAAVEPEPDAALTAADVQGFIARHLAGFKVPRTVTFHEHLPREDSGKIFKRKLRDPYWEAAGRSI